MFTRIFPFIPLLLWFGPVALCQQYYGLVIGVNRYSGDFAPLQYAERDAQGVGESLARIGYEVVTMGHDQPSGHLDPTNANKILAQVRLLADMGKSGDTLVLFMSGHGCQFPDDQETYFCPADADLKRQETFLPISAVMDLMSQSEATHRLVLLDACREEILSPVAPKNLARRIQIPNLVNAQKQVPKSLAVFFSCSPSQLSFEDPELPNLLDPDGQRGQGIFSHFVMQYLTGQAADKFYTDEGELNVSLMENFVSTATREHARKLNKGQVPKLKFDGGFALGQRPVSATPISMMSANAAKGTKASKPETVPKSNPVSARVRSRISRSAIYQNSSTFDPVDHRVGIETGTEVVILEQDTTTKRKRVEWIDTKGVKRSGWIDAFNLE